MSPSGNKRFGLLGNLENRRVRDYVQTLKELGQPEPLCFAYTDLLQNPRPLPVDCLRIDSPGENDRVAQLLIERGGGPEKAEIGHGEIAYLREYYEGYRLFLHSLKTPAVNAPEEIAVMFDKWACHQRFIRAGLPRPASQLATVELLQAPQGRYFLKPLHGSSASGVCAVRWHGRRRQLIAPIEIEGGRLYNTLRVRTYRECEEIDFILNRLLPQGMMAEQWIPKLSLPGGFTDLRVLVIAGKARHRVVRQSRTPMTNLHLGNRRGQPEEIAEFLPAALELAERAAACFPGCLYAGVDVLLDLKGRPLIGEINAFGDLLPNLEHQGESAYAAIIRQVLARPAQSRAL
ncbi:MAG: STM4014 family protein [Candidatus Eremiobacteraeota bacterium]|nr:STM4014 family protein [Candidatus Eremiobacteraeota bacterium]MCW5872729.1 STM4014 family protein [Candidatus Eremiobacteraeota bacterium]